MKSTGRRNMLQTACWVLKAVRPEASNIVGIATEEGSVQDRSEDAVFHDARTWSEQVRPKPSGYNKISTCSEAVSAAMRYASRNIRTR